MKRAHSLREVDVSSGPTAGVSLVEEPDIDVGTQNHVTGLINDAVRWVGSNTAKEEMDSVFSGSCSISLVGAMVLSATKKLVVHSSGVVEQ